MRTGLCLRTGETVAVPDKPFWVPHKVRLLETGEDLAAVTRSLNWPPGGVCSRREMFKFTAAGVAATTILGLTPRRSEAALPGLALAALKFVGAVFVGVAADLVSTMIKEANWYKKKEDATDKYRTPEEKKHYRYAAETTTDNTLGYQKDRFNNYFMVNYFGWYGGNNSYLTYWNYELTSQKLIYLDFNAPEYTRFSVERKVNYPYQPFGIRRSLTEKDRELFDATLKVYEDVPRNATITPDYAREVIDEDGKRYTGFGTDIVQNETQGKNFMIGTESSYG